MKRIEVPLWELTPDEVQKSEKTLPVLIYDSLLSYYTVLIVYDIPRKKLRDNNRYKFFSFEGPSETP